jgi:hypothetical protein
MAVTGVIGEYGEILTHQQEELDNGF